MKITSLINLTFLSLTFVISQSSTETCKCWDGYEPRNGTDGPECAGVFLRNVMPCNIPALPKCECTGNVSRIIIERQVTWCSTVQDGKEIKRWRCENKKEWEEYEKQTTGYISKS